MFAERNRFIEMMFKTFDKMKQLDDFINHSFDFIFITYIECETRSVCFIFCLSSCI